MRFSCSLLAAVTGLVLVPTLQAAEGCFGTKVDFVDTPKEAATLARQQEKLVLILHVSGHFEDPRFT